MSHIRTVSSLAVLRLKMDLPPIEKSERLINGRTLLLRAFRRRLNQPNIQRLDWPNSTV